MNRFFTLLLAATCLTAVGQVTYPYNPDGNADGDIAVGDLQDFLVTYGNPFIPEQIFVDGLTFDDFINQQDFMIDSLVAAISLFLDNGQRCNVFIPDENASYHADIPNSCNFVVVAAQYGQTWPNNVNDRPKIRLPQNGLFLGQRIHMHRHADYSDPWSFQIQHNVNGQWVVLTEIAETQGGLSAFSSPAGVKTFVWTQTGWSYSSGVNQTIYASP